ncbi:MAG: TlpA disulfide reductase family protein, partial [Rikenellaceae bacterium]
EQFADRNSVLAAISRLNAEKHADVIDKVVARLESINPNYAPLVKYKKNVLEAKKQKERLAIGQPAPEFSFPTPDGKKNLGPKSYRGKLLVIDFWASWCGPCRMEIPHMKEFYEAYKSKGVAILGVSIDKKDADWKKALSEEKMTWDQVSAPDAGKGIMKDYQFSGIPYIILLDQNGKIIAKGLRGKDIDRAVDEALKNYKK